MKILTISILVFLLIGGYIIYQAGNTNFSEGEDRGLFLFKFSKWVFNVGGNVVDVTGSAIGTAMDHTWLPETNSTENKSE